MQVVIVRGTSFSSASSANLAYEDAEALNASRAAIQGDQSALQQWTNSRYYEMNNVGWQPNRYTFQLPNGEGGTFRYDFKNGNLVKLPYTPTKISPDNVMENNFFPGEFTITDQTGTVYTFKTQGGLNSNPNTWYLTRMVSSDKTDTIRLVYKATPNVYFAPTYTSVLQMYEEATVSESTAMQALRQYPP